MAQVETEAEGLEGADSAEPTDMDVRIEMMTRRVEAAEASRDAAQQELGEHHNVMGIFIAPEWSVGKNRTDTEMEEFRTRFAALSAEYEHILMAPGSAVWQERRDKSSSWFKSENVMHNSADVFFQGEQVHTQHKVNEGGDHLGGIVNRFDNDAAVTEERAEKWWNKADERDGEIDSTFAAGGIDFSMDICAEIAKKSRQTRSWPPRWTRPAPSRAPLPEPTCTS